MATVEGYIEEQPTDVCHIVPIHAGLVDHIESLLATALEREADSIYNNVDPQRRLERCSDPVQLFKPHVLVAILKIAAKTPGQAVAHSDVAEQVSESLGIDVREAVLPYVERNGEWSPDFRKIITSSGVTGWAFAEAYYSTQRSISNHNDRLAA